MSLLLELVYSLELGGIVKDELAASAGDLQFLRGLRAFGRSFAVGISRIAAWLPSRMLSEERRSSRSGDLLPSYAVNLW